MNLKFKSFKKIFPYLYFLLVLPNVMDVRITSTISLYFGLLARYEISFILMYNFTHRRIFTEDSKPVVTDYKKRAFPLSKECP